MSAQCCSQCNPFSPTTVILPPTFFAVTLELPKETKEVLIIIRYKHVLQSGHALWEKWSKKIWNFLKSWKTKGWCFSCQTLFQPALEDPSSEYGFSKVNYSARHYHLPLATRYISFHLYLKVDVTENSAECLTALSAQWGLILHRNNYSLLRWLPPRLRAQISLNFFVLVLYNLNFDSMPKLKAIDQF